MSPKRTPAWLRRLEYDPPVDEPMHERDLERPWRWVAWTIGAALVVCMAGAAAWAVL